MDPRGWGGSGKSLAKGLYVVGRDNGVNVITKNSLFGSCVHLKTRPHCTLKCGLNVDVV